MTPHPQPQPQQQNCGHYDPCGERIKHGHCPKDAYGIRCPYDTRTHTSPPAPVIQQEVRGFVMIDRQRDFVLWLQQHDKAQREKVLEWAKKHHWPTTGGHRVIGFSKLKEFLTADPLRAQEERCPPPASRPRASSRGGADDSRRM